MKREETKPLNECENGKRYRLLRHTFFVGEGANIKNVSWQPDNEIKFSDYLWKEAQKELMIKISNMDTKELFEFLNKCNSQWNLNENNLTSK